jgi:hypothetical protein
MAARRRPVATDLAHEDRRCLYCLRGDGGFAQEEHVVPRALGEHTDEYVLGPGAVCDLCNGFLGRQVDAPFTHRYDIALTRGLEGLSARSGRLEELQSVAPIARVDVEVKPGISVAMFVDKFEHLPNGGFRVHVQPKRAAPDDMVARTVRALWKIALGVLRGYQGPSVALDPRWDGLREAVLGAPFTSYLLQAPFRAIATTSMNVNLELRADPPMITFQYGGVLLAAPLVPNTSPPSDVSQFIKDGWTLLTTGDRSPRVLVFELEPTPQDLPTEL